MTSPLEECSPGRVFWRGFGHDIGTRAFETLTEAQAAVERDMPKRLRSIDRMHARLKQNYLHCMQMADSGTEVVPSPDGDSRE